MKIWRGIVSASILWGVQNGDTWAGSIPYSDRNIILSGGSASLTLTKNASLSSMQFYHNSGNTISVSNNAQLTISLGGYSNDRNTFLLAGGIIQVNNGGSFTLKDLYRLSIGSGGGGLEVNQGGNLEVVWAREIKNITKYGQRDGIINNGGNLTLKTEVGVFNSDLTTDGSLD